MTLSEIRSALETEHPILTEQVNGQVRQLTAAQRSAVLDRWAQVQWEAAQPSPPPPVPDISNAQMRLWLIENGYYTTVTGYINSIADPIQKLKAQTEFQARNTIQRGHPLVAVIAGVLGLDAAATDQAFREAALL